MWVWMVVCLCISALRWTGDLSREDVEIGSSVCMFLVSFNQFLDATSSNIIGRWVGGWNSKLAATVTSFGSMYCHQHELTALIFWILWLHFWTIRGIDNVSFIFIYIKKAQQSSRSWKSAYYVYLMVCRQTKSTTLFDLLIYIYRLFGNVQNDMLYSGSNDDIWQFLCWGYHQVSGLAHCSKNVAACGPDDLWVWLVFRFHIRSWSCPLVMWPLGMHVGVRSALCHVLGETWKNDGCSWSLVRVVSVEACVCVWRGMWE